MTNLKFMFLALLTLMVCLSARPLFAQCQHIQEAIEGEEQAKKDDFATGMAGMMGGASIILPNCKGYDCVRNTEKNNNEVINRYANQSARHDRRVEVLNRRLKECKLAVRSMEALLNQAHTERQASQKGQ